MNGLSIILALVALFAASLVFWLPPLLHRHERAITSDLIFRIELGVIAVLVAGLALLVGPGTEASFVAAAQTEILSVKMRPEDQTVRWPAPTSLTPLGGDIPTDCQPQAFLFNHTGAPPVTAKFEVLYPRLAVSAAPSPAEESLRRLALDRPGAGIRVILDGGLADVGAILCSNGQQVPATSKLRIEYEAPAGAPPPTLPVNGMFTIGRSVADSAETDPTRAMPLLLTGALTVEAEPLLGKGRSRAEAPLQTGDVLEFMNAGGLAPGTGFVRADHGALEVMAYANAERAVVTRGRVLGQIPVIYSPTLWARIQAMDEWNAVILLGGLALAVLTAARNHLGRRAAHADREDEK